MSELKAGPAKRVTTADIAKACGVSRATVSYVLNNVPGRGISAATRELVIETAHRLGHVPHGPARLLRTGRSNIVLALVRDYTIGYVADRLIEELDRALTERNIMLMVHRFDEELRPLSELWGLVAPDLIVSMGGLVVPDLPPTSPVRVVSVQGIYPHHSTGELQVRYLASRGHTRIGYAYTDNPRVRIIAEERFGGAVYAAESLGLPALDVKHVALGVPDAALAAIDEWTSGPESVTAIATHNDEMAIVLISALRARGMEAGKDLAVIGVDNIPLARIGVTTVEIDIERYTELVLDRVLRVVEGEEPSERPTTLADADLLRLIVRESA